MTNGSFTERHDVVNARIAEALQLRHIAGHVSRAAGGRERARQRKQNDATPAEQLVAAKAMHLAVAQLRQFGVRHAGSFKRDSLAHMAAKNAVAGEPLM
jgi:hypothetical protein